MNKITPFLWFDDNAEETMNFYASVFKNSKIVRLCLCYNAGKYIKIKEEHEPGRK